MPLYLQCLNVSLSYMYIYTSIIVKIENASDGAKY